MFDKKHALMPALLTAAMLALAGTAVAQEKGALDDLHETTGDAATSVPLDLFSATDHHSTFVVDTCMEQHGATPPSSLTTATRTPLDYSTYEVAEEGELVIVDGFTADAPPTVLNFAQSGVFLDATPCCLCGTQGSNPFGCVAYGDSCCCKAEMSPNLDKMTCYCQGGKGCGAMGGATRTA